MDVQWDYEGIQFRHTPKEVDDETAWGWQRISSGELVTHAANLHLFRTMGETPNGVPLWSVRRPRLPEPVTERPR